MKKLLLGLILLVGMTASAQWTKAVDNNPDDKYITRVYSYGVSVGGVGTKSANTIHLSHQQNDIKLYLDFGSHKLTLNNGEKIVMDFIFDKSSIIYYQGAETSMSSDKTALFVKGTYSHRATRAKIIKKVLSSNTVYVRFRVVKGLETVKVIGVGKYDISNSALSKEVFDSYNLDNPFRKHTIVIPESSTSLGWEGANPFDLRYYVDTFVKDAKENGVSPFPGIINISFEQLEGNRIATAYNMNKYGVLVKVDPENWNAASDAKRWYIIYHELGHDILDFEHGTGGDLMNPVAPFAVTYAELIELKNKMFETYKNKNK